MRHVFESMGTVISVDLPAHHGRDVAAVEKVFERADARFSLYRDTSELSRIAVGQLSLRDSSGQLRDVYLRAMRWGHATNGAFSPNRPDGVIDLNGIVKADAIAAAGEALTGAGCRDWSINAGGDILVAGGDRATAVADPFDSTAVLASVMLSGTRRAIATSGSAQRGDHIWRGGALAPSEFTQVTVIADGIVPADVLATAIVAGGHEALDDACDRWDIDVLAVLRTGELLATPGMRSRVHNDPHEQRSSLLGHQEQPDRLHRRA